VPPVVALTEAGVFVVTAVVLAVKVAEVAPAGTVTEPGTVTELLPEESVTVVPDAAAPPVRVTVPVDELPPLTEAGEKETEEMIAGRIVRRTLSVTPPPDAVRLARSVLATICDVMAKEAVVEPAGTTTVAGTVTCETSEVKATLKPPVGAAALIVTDPVIVPPPYAGFGNTVKPVKVVAKVPYSAG